MGYPSPHSLQRMDRKGRISGNKNSPPIGNAPKKTVILRRTHRIDCNVEMPMVPVIVHVAGVALRAVSSAREGRRCGALVDDHEGEGIVVEDGAVRRDGGDFVAESAGSAGTTGAVYCLEGES